MIVCASDGGLPASASRPLLPSSTTSGRPPTRVATTGFPQAYAICKTALWVMAR